MNDNLVAWLLPHRKKSGPICPTCDAYYTRIQKAKEAAGIQRLTPDGLRHSFCSYHYALDQDAGLTMAPHRACIHAGRRTNVIGIIGVSLFLDKCIYKGKNPDPYNPYNILRGDGQEL